MNNNYLSGLVSVLPIYVPESVMQLFMNISEFSEVSVGLSDGDGGLVHAVHSLEHASLAEQLGSFVQKLEKIGIKNSAEINQVPFFDT